MGKKRCQWVQWKLAFKLPSAACFIKKEGRGDFRRFIIQKYIFWEIIDYKKIINDLPHSNPFIKEMVIQMRQLVNHIECHRWYSDISNTIWQANNIWALQICIPFEPFLQTCIIDRIIHCAREEMQLHRHAVQRRLQMMIPYIITYHKMLLGIFRYLFTACIHPNIYIPGFREYAFGYIKAFPCPFRMQHLRPSSLSIE